MNHHDRQPDELQPQAAELNQATAPAAEQPATLAEQVSSETAALREAYLAFGQLLCAAEPSMDEQTLVRHIQIDAERRAWRRGILTAALAASVLIVAGIVLRMRSSESPVANDSGSQVAGKSLPPTTLPLTTLPPVRPSPLSPSQPIKVAPSNVGSDRLAWDDQLDRRVNRMQKQVRSIKRPRDAQPDPIAVLRSKIDLLQREALSGRL